MVGDYRKQAEIRNTGMALAVDQDVSLEEPSKRTTKERWRGSKTYTLQIAVNHLLVV